MAVILLVASLLINIILSLQGRVTVQEPDDTTWLDLAKLHPSQQNVGRTTLNTPDWLICLSVL